MPQTVAAVPQTVAAWTERASHCYADWQRTPQGVLLSSKDEEDSGRCLPPERVGGAAKTRKGSQKSTGRARPSHIDFERLNGALASKVLAPIPLLKRGPNGRTPGRAQWHSVLLGHTRCGDPRQIARTPQRDMDMTGRNPRTSPREKQMNPRKQFWGHHPPRGFLVILTRLT